MSYSRKDIEEIITRNKKKQQQKSPDVPSSQKKLYDINKSISSKDLSTKYQQLHTKYKYLLQDSKSKTHELQQKQTQIKRLKIQKQRDQKQLYRLRSMIGFIKKYDQAIQVNIQQHPPYLWQNKNEKISNILTNQDIQYPSPMKYTTSTKYLKSTSPKQLNSTTYSSNKLRQSQIVKNYQENQFANLKKDHFGGRNYQCQKIANNYFKNKDKCHYQSKLNKICQTNYSKLRFSRKIDHV